MAEANIQRLIVSEVKEVMTVPPAGTTTFSFLSGSIFYITYSLGPTISFTNIPVTEDGVTSITLITPTNTIPRPTTLTVNGTTQAVRWAGGTAPSGSGNINYWNYNILVRNGVIEHVAGSVVSYG
jgi:hypothetical protein